VDKNEAISALEAFHYAQRKTADFYESQKRLATEHAVLEDTGKGEGERVPLGRERRRQAGRRLSGGAVWRQRRRRARPAKRPLLEKKEQLEQAIDKLKYEKAAMPADAYKKQLTLLLLELARTQEALDK